MIKYNYTKENRIQFFEQHDADSSTNGFIKPEDEQTLIDSGVEIAPYVEQVKTIDDIRAERDSLLASNVDIYTPLWWSELSVSKKAKVKAYRQELLDITKQDPASVVWPTPPAI